MTSPVVLTARQREVARLLDQGKSQAQVAEILEISVRAVEGHAKAIRDKTGAPTTREAVAQTRKRGR